MHSNPVSKDNWFSVFETENYYYIFESQPLVPYTVKRQYTSNAFFNYINSNQDYQIYFDRTYLGVNLYTDNWDVRYIRSLLPGYENVEISHSKEYDWYCITLKSDNIDDLMEIYNGLLKAYNSQL